MNDGSGCCTMPCRVVACNAENRNTDHGYEAREGNPIHKEGKIRIRKQVGGVGFVIATRVDKRGVYCNTVGIWKSGSEDVQRDVFGRPPRGGAGFQEAIDLRATHHRRTYLQWERHQILSPSRSPSSEIVNVVFEKCD